MTTKAVEDGDSYILNGRKCFITARLLPKYGYLCQNEPGEGRQGHHELHR